MTNYINELDEAQKKAALHPPTPLIVYAGAGSGKTRVLTSRIAHQIETNVVEPRNIFASTFTKAAAQEMSERVFSLTAAPDLKIATFHSLMFGLLNDERHANGEDRLEVCKEYERKMILQDLLGKPSKEFPSAINIDADFGNVSSLISSWKSNLIHSYDDQIHQTLIEAPYASDMWAAAKIYPMYEAALTVRGKVDFDDMLLKAYDLLSTNAAALARARQKWTAFFIDEAQDTSLGQWAIIHLLADRGLEPNITVVGDTRQALYRFTSAVPELMDDFIKDYRGAKRIDLKANYRSTYAITTSANQLAGPLGLPDQDAKRAAGSPPIFMYCDSEVDQARQVIQAVENVKAAGGRGSDIAVLVRTNAQTAAIESEFVAAGLPYWCKNGGFFDRMEIGDIMAYLKLIDDHTDEDALSRIINRPKRYLGAAYVEQVVKNAQRSDGDLVKAMRVTTSYRNKKLFPKQLESAAALADLIEHLSPENGVEVSPRFAIGRILADTDYMEWLKVNSGVGGGADDSKAENVDKLIEIASRYSEISTFLKFAAETSRLQLESGDSTEISTVHGSKGREWPVVILTNFVENSIPHRKSIEAGLVQDERRIAYVAMTRARDSLIVGIPRVGSLGQPLDPSRFVRNVVISENDIVDTGDDPNWIKGRSLIGG